MGVNTAADYGDGVCVNAPGRGNSTVVECSSSNPWMTAQAAVAVGESTKTGGTYVTPPENLSPGNRISNSNSAQTLAPLASPCNRTLAPPAVLPPRTLDADSPGWFTRLRVPPPPLRSPSLSRSRSLRWARRAGTSPRGYRSLASPPQSASQTPRLAASGSKSEGCLPRARAVTHGNPPLQAAPARCMLQAIKPPPIICPLLRPSGTCPTPRVGCTSAASVLGRARGKGPTGMGAISAT